MARQSSEYGYLPRTGLPCICDFLCKQWSSVFCHVARLPAFTPAYQALKLQVDLSLNTFPSADWRCCLGRPHGRWVDQLRRDNHCPASLWHSPSWEDILERCYGPSWLRADYGDQECVCVWWGLVKLCSRVKPLCRIRRWTVHLLRPASVFFPPPPPLLLLPSCLRWCPPSSDLPLSTTRPDFQSTSHFPLQQLAHLCLISSCLQCQCSHRLATSLCQVGVCLCVDCLMYCWSMSRNEEITANLFVWLMANVQLIHMKRAWVR